MTTSRNELVPALGTPVSETPALEVRGISVAYGERAILENVSLTLERGELVSLLGLSGSGKTTLFHVISGLLRPDAGSVWLEGREITGRTGEIAYMLQKDLLLRHLRVVDNVALPLVLRGLPRARARAEAAQHFADFGLEGTQMLYPAELSGGMAQRAALLRTWLVSGAAMLLDEPFSALDALTRRQLHGWFQGKRGELGLTTLLITHDIDEAIYLSDRILILGGSPASIRAEFEIRRPDAAEGEDFATSAAYLGYKRRLLQALDGVRGG
ncbi:MAG: ABC transporter ATP-binding protein [Bacillota bacterium]|nr:ABC transporter ATP-binding protein [Bacillota bacterium]